MHIPTCSARLHSRCSGAMQQHPSCHVSSGHSSLPHPLTVMNRLVLMSSCRTCRHVLKIQASLRSLLYLLVPCAAHGCDLGGQLQDLRGFEGAAGAEAGMSRRQRLEGVRHTDHQQRAMDGALSALQGIGRPNGAPQQQQPPPPQQRHQQVHLAGQQPFTESCCLYLQAI